MSFVMPLNKQIYYAQVWALVRQIPVGQVATYGQIAKLLPMPEGVSHDDHRIYASRWVGLAMAACPDDVPWHRVVNTQGKISRQTQATTQKQLLVTEGVSFSNEKLSLQEYQWSGPGMEQSESVQGQLF